VGLAWGKRPKIHSSHLAMKLVLTHLSVAGKEDAPMLQVEYAVRVPKALRGLERVHSWGNAMVIDARLERLETMSRWSLRSTCQGQHLELRQHLSRCKWRLAPNLPAPWDQAPALEGRNISRWHFVD